MAVYERTYRPYTGTLTPERWRFLVLPRYALREVFRSRIFAVFFAACFIPPLGFAGWVYLPHNLKFVETFGFQPAMLATIFRIDAAFFLRLLAWQGFFGLLLAMAVGPALISPDLRNNGLPLYLSRPFSRAEYVLGKASVLVLLLSAISWVPGLLIFGWQSYLAGFDWLREHSRIGPAVFVASWVGIVVLTLLSLALSAYLKWKPVTRAAMIGVFFMAGILANTINLMFRTDWGTLVDLIAMIRVVWYGMFAVDGGPPVPVWAALLSLLAACVFFLLLLERKLKAYEVVR